MATRQILANCRYVALSGGPRAAAGNARSRRNVRHGLPAQAHVAHEAMLKRTPAAQENRLRSPGATLSASIRGTSTWA